MPPPTPVRPRIDASGDARYELDEVLATRPGLAPQCNRTPLEPKIGNTHHVALR